MRLWLILMVFASRAFATEIVITIDDHPMPDQHPLFTYFSVNERTERYCQALQKHGCKAVFFCVGKNCEETSDPTSLATLNDAGHFLANHSYSHPHLRDITLDAFARELDATDALLSPYSQFRKWYRFPFLDTGGSEEKCTSAHEILKDHGYKEGFVTINTFDWHVNYCLRQAVHAGKTVNLPKLKEAYLFLLHTWCTHAIEAYHELGLVKLPQVLLLHANDLNALFLDDVLTMIEENGWTLGSPEPTFSEFHPGLMPPSPPLLNVQAIEDVLDTYGAFS